MTGLSFVFNPNLTTAQVETMLNERIEAQKKRGALILAGAKDISDQIIAGKLPMSALDEYMRTMGPLLCL